MSFEEYIAELNGYLKALAMLGGPNHNFRAELYEAENDIDSFIQNNLSNWVESKGFRYSGRSIIEYKSLCENIKEMVFCRIIDRNRMHSEAAADYVTRTLREHIGDFIGFGTMALGEDLEFYQLIKRPVYLLDIGSDRFLKSLCFLVKIENYFLLTSMVHWNREKM